MQLIGDVTLLHRFKQLPVKLQKKHGRRAVAKAGRRVAKAAKSKSPKRTGQLKKSIGVRPRTYKSGVFAIVGPRKGFRITVDGKPHDPAMIAHIVELSNPFLRPAHDETAQSNIQLIGSELAKGIEQEAKS